MESNFERGLSFGKAARPIIERALGLTLEAEVPTTKWLMAHFVRVKT
jgi:hypothetical protein